MKLVLRVKTNGYDFHPGGFARGRRSPSVSEPLQMEIRFYFDFISPYAYLAWTQLRDRPQLKPVPILLAALLNHHGTKGPAEVESKRRYTFRHILRLARDYGVEIAVPASHPFNPLRALRLASLPGLDQKQVIDRLFQATWAEGLDVTDPEVLKSILPEVDHALLDQPECKARVRRQTEEALAEGVFGVPTMIAGDELFWGCDSLAHLNAYLEGRNPITDTDIQSFLNVTPSARRI